MKKSRSSMLQRQIDLNSNALTRMYNAKNLCREYAKEFFEKAEDEIAEGWCKERGILSKMIKRHEELQKFLKRDLQEAYIAENFERTWEEFEEAQESFLDGRIRMAAEDGFVEPGVVAEIVE